MKKNFISFAALAMCAAAVLSSCSDEESDTKKTNSDLLSGTISENVTLESGKTYELEGAYTVPTGVTLTIEKGVTIVAQDGGNVDFILVQRGGKINAVGTAEEPIIMTSELKEHGAWGGVHICGNAPMNNGSVGISEVGDSPYGGDASDDNSGTLEYIRVEYAGYLYSKDKECNGFTFYGVGSGTTLKNLIAYKGSDDGYEWFGGSVNGSNLISVDNQDDSFDWTYGFTGTIDGAYALQLTDKCDHLLEGDSNKVETNNDPTSKPTFKNAVLVGIDNADGGNRGIRIRRNSQIILDNVQVAGKTNSFDFQSDNTKKYLTDYADTALVNVKATGDIIDAEDDKPLETDIFEGLTINKDLKPSAPTWATGNWVLLK